MDRFSDFPTNLVAPARDAAPVMPSDSADLTQLPRALFIGTAGNVAVVMAGGQSVTFENCAAGSKDVVSRTWRKVKLDWDAWFTRDLAGEDIVRLICDGTVIKTRLDRKATEVLTLDQSGRPWRWRCCGPRIPCSRRPGIPVSAREIPCFGMPDSLFPITGNSPCNLQK